MYYIWAFLQTQRLLVKKKEIQMSYYCDAAECTSQSCKAKKLNIYPFMADVTWVKWLKDLSAQRRWTTQIQRERKIKR